MEEFRGMEEKDWKHITRKLLAAILLSCSLCCLGVIGIILSDRSSASGQETYSSSGQTMMVMSNGTLRLKNQICAYTIVVDTDTARRYLIIEGDENQISVTNLEQPVPEL